MDAAATILLPESRHAGTPLAKSSVDNGASRRDRSPKNCSVPAPVAHAGRLNPAFTHTSTVNSLPPRDGSAPCRYCPIWKSAGVNFTPVPSPTPGPLSPKASAVGLDVTVSGYAPPIACAACVDPPGSVSGHHSTGESWLISCAIGDFIVTRDSWSMRSVAVSGTTGKDPLYNPGDHPFP